MMGIDRWSRNFDAGFATHEYRNNFSEEQALNAITSSYPYLYAARSLFDTRFSDANDLFKKTLQRLHTGNEMASNGETQEFAPAYSEGSGHPPTVKLLSQRGFKQISYRPAGAYPTSTGTSKTDYPCLTNGLVPCVAVMMTGASPDGAQRKARVFHVASANTKAIDSLIDYKRYLSDKGLTNQFAVLAGGEVRALKYKELGLDDEAAEKAAARTRDELASLKTQLGNADIRIARDDTGENRPDYLTGTSNVGFELKEKDGQVKFFYLKDVSMA